MSVDQTGGFVKPQKSTKDAFLDGILTLTQPEKGFRAGSDSVLLGAAVNPRSSSIIDLGAGVGAAGFVAATHAGTASLTLVERDEATAEFACLNIKENGFSARARVLVQDVLASGPDRVAAGMVQDSFSTVISNPPYFDAGAGTKAPDAKRAAARHMPSDSLDHWVRAAVGVAAPRGEVILINQIDALSPMLAAMHARLGAICVLPIAPRRGADATRILVRGIKGSKAPLRLLSPFVLHEDEGNGFAPEAAAILRGKSRLNW